VPPIALFCFGAAPISGGLLGNIDGFYSDTGFFAGAGETEKNYNNSGLAMKQKTKI